MKKITMMAACFALLLSSCVTNEESTSVTNIRDAKAEHLKSLATLNNAEAAAAKTLADAEAALKAAQAKAEEAKAKEAEAQAKLLEAQAENSKVIAAAEAELLKAQAALEAAKAAKEEAEAAKLAEEVERAKLEYEALKAEYAARVAAAEQAKAEAELAKAKAIAELELVTINAKAALAVAKKELATAEQDLKNELDRIEAENTVVVDVMALFYTYQHLALDLIDAEATLVDYKTQLALAQEGLVTAQEAIAALVEVSEEGIAYYQKEIAYAELKLAKLQSFVTIDVAELEARLEELTKVELANANNEGVMAYNNYIKVEAAQSEAIDAVVNGTWVSEFSYNPWGGEVFHTGYMDANGNDMTQAFYEYESSLYSWVTSWEEYEQALADWFASNGVSEVYGVFQEGEAHPVTGKVSEVFVPMFGVNVAWAQEPVSIDYTLESADETFTYTYNPLVGVGFIDAAAMKARIAEVVENQKIGDEAYMKNMQERVDAAKADVELWAGVVKAANAWCDVYVEHDLAHKNAYVNSRYLVHLKDGYLRDENGYIPTALYAYNQAVRAENNAKAAYENAVAVVDGLKEHLAYLESKEVRWDLEDAIEPFVKPAAQTAEALKKAEAAVEAAAAEVAKAEKAVAAAEADLEAAEYAERDAYKAYKAVNANPDASKIQIANALAAYEKAQGITFEAQVALEKAEYVLAEAEAAAEKAEYAAADAKVAAEIAAAELKSAQDALADLDVAIADMKKQIAWAEEDLAPYIAAVEEATAAVAPAEAALEAAKVEADKLAAVLATGDLQRAYTVALAGNYGYDNPVEAVEEAIYNYENAVRNVAYYEGMMETDDSFEQMVEGWYALVEKAEAAYAEAVANIAVVNEALQATGEAFVAYTKAYDAYQVLYAEMEAINETLDENSSLANAIANLEETIEDLNDEIAEIEAMVAEMTDPNTTIDIELVITEWTKKVELQETYIELLKAEVAAAKAELEAATK